MCRVHIRLILYSLQLHLLWSQLTERWSNANLVWTKYLNIERVYDFYTLLNRLFKYCVGVYLHLPLDKVLPNSLQFRCRSSERNSSSPGILPWGPGQWQVRQVAAAPHGRAVSARGRWADHQSEFRCCNTTRDHMKINVINFLLPYHSYFQQIQF